MNMKSILAFALLCAIMPCLPLLSSPTYGKTANENGPRIYGWDTVFSNRDTVFVRGNDVGNDTIITRPVYKINNQFIERLVDSFLFYDICYAYFFPSKNFPGYFLISSNFEIKSIDSITGIYLDGYQKMPIYSISDSILTNFHFEKTQDSVHILLQDRLQGPLPLGMCGAKHLVLKTNDKRRLQFGIQGRSTPKDIHKNKYFKWLYDEGWLHDNSTDSIKKF